MQFQVVREEAITMQLISSSNNIWLWLLCKVWTQWWCSRWLAKVPKLKACHLNNSSITRKVLNIRINSSTARKCHLEWDSKTNRILVCKVVQAVQEEVPEVLVVQWTTIKCRIPTPISWETSWTEEWDHQIWSFQIRMELIHLKWRETEDNSTVCTSAIFQKKPMI